MSTPRKIVSKSVQLFNQHGVEAVSINQICHALTISPGNFTYHFKKKSDLVAHIFSKFEEQLAQILDDVPTDAEPRVLGSALYQVMELVYRHRHIFLGASYLIKNNLISQSEYQTLVTETKNRFRRQLEQLIASSKMAPIEAPFSIVQLVDSIWQQWLGWLLSMQISPPRKKTRKQLLIEELLNILFLNSRYIDPRFVSDIRKEILAMNER